MSAVLSLPRVVICVLFIVCLPELQINVKNCNIWENSIKKVFCLWRNFLISFASLSPSFFIILWKGKIKLLREIYWQSEIVGNFSSYVDYVQNFFLMLLLFCWVWFVNFQFISARRKTLFWSKHLENFIFSIFSLESGKHSKLVAARVLTQFEFAKFSSVCSGKKVFHSLPSLTSSVIH